MDYTTMDDETLIRLIAHAHAEALSELYDRYSRLVFSLALNSVGDQATAEEITQDVFVRVWQRAGQYRADRGKVSTWLTGVTRYRAIDQLRRQGSRPEQSSVAWADVSPTAVPAVNGPEEATHLAMQRERVRAALAQLPVAEPRPSLWQQLVGLFGRAAPAWGAVALILVVVLAASNLWW